MLSWPILKAYADNKVNANATIKMMISVFNRVENILQKGENAGNQHFLLFTQYLVLYLK